MNNELSELAKQLVRPLQLIKLDAEYHENTHALVQAKFALDTVESTLLLHKIYRGQQELDLVPVHIGDSLNNVLSSLRDYFYSQNVEYEIDYAHELPPIYADKAVLEAALKMLCYGVQSYNEQRTVLQIKVYKADTESLRVSISSKGLHTDKITLKKHSTNHSENPIETSRHIFEVIGGKMSKTKTNDLRGFSVRLNTSKQLTLV